MLKFLAPELADDVLEARRADLNAADQRPHIAVIVPWRAHIGEPQLPHLSDILAALFYLHRRYADALMKYFRCLGGKGARRHAAHFRYMTDGDGKGDQFTVDEHRREERMLRRVQAAAIGIVVDDHVALFDIVERDFL